MCRRPYPWSVSQSPHEQAIQEACKKYLKAYVSSYTLLVATVSIIASILVFQEGYGYFGPFCMNNFALLSDMRVTRNHIYEYHSCYTGRKDYNFINKTLRTVKEMVSG